MRRDYPEIDFIAFDMSAETDLSALDNMFGIAFKQNEGSYLAGALAGLITKTNKIGVFIFNDVPIGNDFLTGYIAGVRETNPDAGGEQRLWRGRHRRLEAAGDLLGHV